MVQVHRARSSEFTEADGECLLTESLSAKEKIILPDETVVAVGDTAAAAILAVLPGVRSKLMRHLERIKLLDLL